jgi:membrane protein
MRPRGLTRDMEALAQSDRTRIGRVTVTSARHRAKAVLRQIYERVQQDDCLDVAAQVSFFFVLSLFPFFLVIAAIIGWLPSTRLWESFVEWIFTYFPRIARLAIIQAILGLSKYHIGVLSFGILTTVWSASSGFASLMEALSLACGAKDTRSYWKKRAIAILATIGSAIFFILSFGLWTVGHWAHGTVVTEFRATDIFQTPWKLLWWLFTLFLLCIALDLIHYVLPDCHHPWRWFSPGTLFAVIAFVLASFGLNLYARYNVMLPRIYGTLAGFIVLMLWIYISTIILLVGAEADTAVAEIRRHEAESQ